jgi:hypothetical protein
LHKDIATARVAKRVVLHFPGFEPLDAKAHYARYVRSAHQSAKVWGLDLEIGPFCKEEMASSFDIDCSVSGGRTTSRVFILDHNHLVQRLLRRPLPLRLFRGFHSAAEVVWQGGGLAYFRHAWRFGLFFVFPFLLVLLAFAASLVIAAAPSVLGLSLWGYLASVPLAAYFFIGSFPLSRKLHTLHLFADWELAVAMAKLDDPEITGWLERCKDAVRTAMIEDADEYVISSHSMGSSVATHVIGMLLEEEPGAFEGKRVVFTTLGGAVLQCAFLKSAAALRARVGAIARAREVFWLEVHCLTDVIHFYKSRVVALAGHADAPQAHVTTIRMRHMLTPQHYRKIRRDFLRVHRQYVLGSDLPSAFDFTLMTAGPLPASSFARFSQDNMPAVTQSDSNGSFGTLWPHWQRSLPTE